MKVALLDINYAWTEYGVTREEVAAYESRTIAEHKRLKASRKLEPLTVDGPRKIRDKAPRR